MKDNSEHTSPTSLSGLGEIAPITDYQWPEITDAIVEKVVFWLKNQGLSEYEEESGLLRDFEISFANYHGVEYALLKSSGTSALFSAYHAIGIRPGDIVIVPAFTFVATVSPLLLLGANIVMVDCDEQSNLCPIDLKRKLDKHAGVKLIVVTHNGGIPAEMDEIMKLKEEHGCKLIEDCARSPGAEYKGRKVGTFGDISCFSFHEKKAVFGGEGGIVLTDDRLLYERMTLIGHYFRSKSALHIQDEQLHRFSETSLGMNFSIHPLSVAIAAESFRSLDALLGERAAAWEFLQRYMQERGVVGLTPLKIPNFCTKNGGYHFIFHFNHEYYGEKLDREGYVKGIRKIGVDARISDNKPLHQFPLFQRDGLEYFGIPGSGVIAENIDNASRFFDSMVTMPPITDLAVLKRYVDRIIEFEQSA